MGEPQSEPSFPDRQKLEMEITARPSFSPTRLPSIQCTSRTLSLVIRTEKSYTPRFSHGTAESGLKVI